MHRFKPQPTLSKKKLAAILAETARVGAMFLDGDALESVHASESSATWTDADNINFAHAPFIAVKKTILTVERIPDFRCFACAFLKRADDPKLIEPVVAGRRNPFGRDPLKPTAAMREAMRKDTITTEVKVETDNVFAYAPVKNSDDETVGMLAVFIQRG